MIRRELAVFLVVGSLTALIDFITYRLLSWSEIVGIDWAKAAGFLIGTLFAYLANRLCTFRHASAAPGSAGRFMLVYATTLGANVLVNAIMLALLQRLSTAFPAVSPAAIPMAFLIATGVSATLNFIGMKWYVFRPTRLSASP